MATEPRRRLTWHMGQGEVTRGTNPGCDAAMRPHVAAPGLPAQEAHRARQVAGRPRSHVGAHVGRHVWLDLEGERRILIGESVPLFMGILSPYFLRVGLCSHTVSVLQDAWRCDER